MVYLRSFMYIILGWENCYWLRYLCAQMVNSAGVEKSRLISEPYMAKILFWTLACKLMGCSFICFVFKMLWICSSLLRLEKCVTGRWSFLNWSCSALWAMYTWFIDDWIWDIAGFILMRLVEAFLENIFLFCLLRIVCRMCWYRVIYKFCLLILINLKRLKLINEILSRNDVTMLLLYSKVIEWDHYDSLRFIQYF